MAIDPERAKQKLREQLDFIQTACQAFDGGKQSHTINIATYARIIFHETRTSVPLLKHLNAPQTDVLTTVEAPVPGAIFSSSGLSWMKFSLPTGTAVYTSIGQTPWSCFVPAQIWWNQSIYLLDSGSSVTRKDLVLMAANKDGGAHVDADLDPKYEAIMRGLVMVTTFVPGKGLHSRRVGDSHLTDLRQIGYELLSSPALRALAAS